VDASRCKRGAAVAARIAQRHRLERVVLLDQQIDRARFLGGCLERVIQDVFRLPGLTGRTKCTRPIPRGASRASTSTVATAAEKAASAANTTAPQRMAAANLR
jgi:hypothetical protein